MDRSYGLAGDEEAAMEIRGFGRTGLRVSALGFGCGAVGGLMVRGSAADQARAVARAVDAGITFFDTAPGYGDGASETNLGRALAKLRPEIVLATKVSLRGVARGSLAAALERSLTDSLRRLGRTSVDLLQFHDAIGASAHASDPSATWPVEVVLGEIVPAFQRVRDAGLARFIGITAIGQTADVLRVIDSGAFDSAQIAYNLLNPSAAVAVPASFPAQDFGRFLPRAAAAGMGTIGIRAIAGGALSGTVERHPIGAADVAPIGTADSYATDVRHAHRFAPLLAAAGAPDLVALALRFAMSAGGPSTVLVGTSTLQQVDHAIAAAEQGPLPVPVLDELPSIWSAMA
jgi:L-galactose dehydrogenase/L-glyceraldehyde 3-phosphate reductase